MPARGFSLIEALLMLIALAVFTMTLYAVVKKDYLTPRSPAAEEAAQTKETALDSPAHP